GELPGTAVDEDEVGPAALAAVGVLLDCAGEAPGQHLTHHAVVVAGGEIRGLGTSFPLSRVRALRLTLRRVGARAVALYRIVGHRILDGAAALTLPFLRNGSLPLPQAGEGIIHALHPPDIELAIRVLDEPFRSRDDHRADRVRPLDVAVVVDLDALGR